MTRRLKVLGTTSIEFALGALVLLFSTFAIFESCYQVYVVNMTEYALRETIRNTKIYQGGGLHDQYESKFKELIENESNLWNFLIDNERFSIDGTYFATYQDFVQNRGHDSQNLTFTYDLAEITVNYRYTPILAIWSVSEQQISRTMVLNLEHEGWDDADTL